MTRPKILLTNPIDPAGVRVLEQSADVLLAPKSDADTLRRLAADWTASSYARSFRATSSTTRTGSAESCATAWAWT